MTGKQLKKLSHETVCQNRIKLIATGSALNSQKCLITLIVGWVIMKNGKARVGVKILRRDDLHANFNISQKIIVCVNNI